MIEQLQNKINTHFQKEIELKKQIISIETNVENLKYKAAEGYISYANDKSQNKLATQINAWEDEKDKLNAELGTKFINMSNLIGQRKPIQQEFKKFANKEMSLKLLEDYYNYYTNYLDSLNFAHRDFVYSKNISIQQLQMKSLIDQLMSRDVILKQLKDEFTKKNILYKPEGVREYQDFKQEPLKLNHIISNYPEFASISYDKDKKYEGKEARPENTDMKLNSNKRVNPKLLSNNAKNKEIYNSKGNDRYFQNSGSNKRNKRTYNYELTPHRKEFKVNHPLNINPSKYSMKLEQFNRELPKVNSSYNKSFYSKNNSLNKSNNSFNKETTDSSGFKRSWEVFDVFEKQRNKMVKTLIRKNIMGRFRGSPYLQG